MASKQTNSFFWYLKGKLLETQHLADLKEEGRYIPTDFEKAEALENKFAKVFFLKTTEFFLPLVFPIQRQKIDFSYVDSMTLHEHLRPILNSVTPDEILFAFIKN